jgi:hypothetical protein
VIDERGRTVRLGEELLAETQRAADSRNESFSKFVGWAIRQVLKLDFLSHENREFVSQIARELGQPWTTLAVLNLLASYARGDARARNLLQLFFAGHDSFRLNPNQNDSQLPIDFPQAAPGGGPEVPSPKAIAPDRPMARRGGSARG